MEGLLVAVQDSIHSFKAALVSVAVEKISKRRWRGHLNDIRGNWIEASPNQFLRLNLREAEVLVKDLQRVKVIFKKLKTR